MDYVHDQNVKLYRKLLAEPHDPGSSRHAILLKLLLELDDEIDTSLAPAIEPTHLTPDRD